TGRQALPPSRATRATANSRATANAVPLPPSQIRIRAAITPQKEKPHRTRPKTFGTESDAARPGLGWESGVGLIWLSAYVGSLLVRSASIFSPYQRCQTNTAT